MTKILLVLDMNKGYVNPTTKRGKCVAHHSGLKEIVPTISEIINSLQRNDVVIYALRQYSTDDPLLKRNGGELEDQCMRGWEEIQLIDELGKGPAGVKQHKLYHSRTDCFWDTNLKEILRNRGAPKNIDLIIVGNAVATTVVHTALTATQLGYNVTVYSSACHNPGDDFEYPAGVMVDFGVDYRGWPTQNSEASSESQSPHGPRLDLTSAAE